MSKRKQQCRNDQHYTDQQQAVPENTLYRIFEKDAHDSYRNHREKYLGHVLCLVVPLKTEYTGKQRRYFFPQHNQRTAHGCSMYQHGKSKIVATLDSQQSIGNFEVSAATHGKILGETLYKSQPQCVKPRHHLSVLDIFSGSLYKMANTMKTKPRKAIVGANTMRLKLNMSGL